MLICKFVLEVSADTNERHLVICHVRYSIEAGTVGALAAVANAVQDALWENGIKQVDMPFTSETIWSMIQSRKIAAE